MINVIKNHIKKNIKKNIPFFIFIAMGMFVLTVWAVMMEFKFHRMDARMAENIKAYEDAYINTEHVHPHPHPHE